MKDEIIAAGFTNVVETVIKTPLGRWPEDRNMRKLGALAQYGFDIGLEGYALATLTRVLNVSSPRRGDPVP